MPEFIPVYQPSLGGQEWLNVKECLDTTWISSRGRFVDAFEAAFADYVGASHAVSVSNGTVALHLALATLGIGVGDKVVVPTFTYIASVNAIRYVGAEPVFVDSDPETLQISASDFAAKVEGQSIAAVIPVHLYGQPADMTAIAEIARPRGIKIVEDCAEAFGSRIGDRHVGSWGDLATYSFFGNKTITTGEGGMVTANDPVLAARLSKLRGQGLAGDREYWHDEVGFNFRMTNICAAIGLAQLQQADLVVARKRELADFYRDAVAGTPLRFHDEQSGTVHSYWMCSVMTPEPSQREPLRNHLRSNGIETRPFFYPAHTMPMYCRYDAGPYPVADDVAARGLNLPSFPGLTPDQLHRVARTLREFYQA